ncbi:MAG: LTA synthase family protein, partial [Rhodanobacter sp.]
MSNPFTPTSPLRQRFRPLWWLGLTYLAISFVTRVVLLIMSGSNVAHTPLNLLYAFGVGLGYDLVTFVYLAWPMVLLLWLVPTRSGALSPLLRWLLYAIGVVLACVLCVGTLHLMYHASLKVTWPAILPFLFVLPLAAFTYTSRIGQWLLYGFGLLLVYGLLLV